MSLIKKNNNNNENDINKTNNTTKDDIDSSIKQVLKKKRISIFKPKEDQLSDFINDEIEEGLKQVKNPKLLLYFLLKTQVFKQYTYIHNFTKENLINSFRVGKYVKLKKNEILFKQGDKTDYFYLVLSGCIGFILTTYDDNILKKNPYSREVNSIRVGAYFGEWGLIYKINRTVSAYAKEDTLLLGFDKTIFRTYYQENIILSENNSKKFVLKHIKTFKELNETTFNSYYREIKKIFCIPGKEIFHKGANADSFYLVNRGSCVVKNGLTNLIIKDSGDFIGIESLYNDKYETTIYPYVDGTVLYKILLNSISDNIIANLKEEFEDYYKKQRRIIKISTINYNKYKDKYQMSFINLLENMKKNKMENKKRANNVNINEIRDNNDKKKKTHNSTPYKVRKFCKVNNFDVKQNNIESSNIISMKSKNIYEDILINQLKSTTNTPRKFINSDINNSNSGTNLDKKSRNNILNINNSNTIFNNNNIDYKIRPYSSLNKNNSNNNNKMRLNFPKKKHDFFYDDNYVNNDILLFREIRRDNHFSNQNFILKKAKSKTRLPLASKNKLMRNKSINNLKEKIKEKKYFHPIFINNMNNPNNMKNQNNFEFLRKVGNKIKLLKNNYCQSEKKMKDYNTINSNSTKDKNNETNKNYESNNETNLEIPLMIIRNVSFYSSK